MAGPPLAAAVSPVWDGGAGYDVMPLVYRIMKRKETQALEGMGMMTDSGQVLVLFERQTCYNIG